MNAAAAPTYAPAKRPLVQTNKLAKAMLASYVNAKKEAEKEKEAAAK